MAAGQAASGGRAGDPADAADAAPGKPQVFRSVTALVIWWIWALFAVGNLIDLAVQGRDHISAVAAAVLVFVTGIAYATAQLPRVIVGDQDVTVRNPLRRHRIPWSAITKVDIADVLRVHVRPGTAGRRKAISAWAIHYSRRRQLSADTRSRRAAARGIGGRPLPYGRGGFGGIGGSGSGGGTGYGSTRANPNTIGSAEAEAERIAKLLTDRAEAAGIERATAATAAGAPAASAPAPALGGPASPASGPASPASGPAEPVTSTWDWRAITAILLPALLLLIVSLT